MIILPDRNIPRARILLPMRRIEWMQPTINARGVKQVWHIVARLSDGYAVWRGVFFDREDFDAFLWAGVTGQLRYNRELWDLPVPAWRPDLGERLVYEFTSPRALTGTSASNQTDTVPSDYQTSGSAIHCWGSGGGATATYSQGASGAAWAQGINISLTPGGSATYRLEAGGAPGTGTGNGNDGKQTWYNDTAFPASGGHKIGADKGLGGKYLDNTTRAGGAAASCYGGDGAGTTTNPGTTYSRSGGVGAGYGGQYGSGGGGGAAGISGDGKAGGTGGTTSYYSGGGGGGCGSCDAATSSTAGTAGPSNDGGAGGHGPDGTGGGAGGTGGVNGDSTGAAGTAGKGAGGGGSGGYTTSTGTATGGNGSNYTAISAFTGLGVGPGGGGGGIGYLYNVGTGGTGGYGAGAGGATGGKTGGTGGQALIVMIYTPTVPSGWYSRFSEPDFTVRQVMN